MVRQAAIESGMILIDRTHPRSWPARRARGAPARPLRGGAGQALSGLSRDRLSSSSLSALRFAPPRRPGASGVDGQKHVRVRRAPARRSGLTRSDRPI
jgi:hypothetical protein